MRLAALGLLLLGGAGCITPLASLTRVTSVTAGAQRFELKSEPAATEDELRLRRSIERAAPKLDRWGGLAAPVTVRIAPTHADLERAVGRHGYDWLRAWAQYDDLIIQSPGSWAGTDRDVDELVVHELTHCLMFQRSGTKQTWASKGIPLWFREGMAAVTAEQGLRFPSLEDLADWLLRNSELDVFAEAEALSQTAYGQIYGLAFHAVRFLLRRYGDGAVTKTMEAMGRGSGFDRAFETSVGLAPRRFEADFLNYVRLRGFRGFGLELKPRLDRRGPDQRPR
ncbi:MAG: hypothetical protein JNJ54_26805 [Myxococcaceae bacterium]|nr:hypothetical protein [Myxococcaceae bacterium]